METINIIKYCCPEKTERLEGSTHLLVCLLVFLFALILEAKIGFFFQMSREHCPTGLKYKSTRVVPMPPFFFFYEFFLK